MHIIRGSTLDAMGAMYTANHNIQLRYWWEISEVAQSGRQKTGS